ncbi:hypothetical protein THIAE_08035 [Thiomicrospira aerophila AL3]|uniref:Uncharacterized protein n=1 Tax=Thiomicrospira aerophila AL3 TaxID=717772 RepID=W0DXM1_9GAMM|nr:hypothetical protein [Thiomicrospira aerophila]AHF01714.1 hypothetical protein THIAE_08035 [Thiomicrospira aerophila AL3]
MDDFKYGKKVVEFWQVTGEVLGSNKFSETYVSSSGGGPNYAPSIHSETVTNHEFWIKTEEGLEKDIKLRGIDVPLRVGQKITLVSAGLKGKDNGWYSLLINHSAGKHWFINNGVDLNNKLKLEKYTGIALLWALIIYLGVAVYTMPMNIANFEITHLEWYLSYANLQMATTAATAYLVLAFFWKRSKKVRVAKKLKQHLEDIAQDAYKV